MASEHLLFRRIAPIAPGEVLWCPLLWAQKIFKRFYFNCCTIILHIPISFYSFYSFVLSYIGIPDYIDLLTVVPRTGTDPGERFVFCVKENSPSFHADPLLDRTIVALRSIKMDGWWLKECRMLWELCRVHWRHEKKKKINHSFLREIPTWTPNLFDLGILIEIKLELPPMFKSHAPRCDTNTGTPSRWRSASYRGNLQQ